MSCGGSRGKHVDTHLHKIVEGYVEEIVEEPLDDLCRHVEGRVVGRADLSRVEVAFQPMRGN